jgi:Porin subfamily
MKMVKSLLLGSAAGLVAVTAGQAADLPVKAKPVEYVKICSLYGAGFYYMPGTDMCIKVGGYARAEITEYSGGNMTQGPLQGDTNQRSTSNLTMRARAYITADAREQTSYGTARGYVAVGVATTDIGNTVLPSILGFNRAFVQWAGITAGITQSFYDFYSAAAMGYRAYNPSSDTGDSGWWVWAYTAQLGNGLSATLSAEQRRGTQICGLSGNVSGGSIFTGGASAGPCMFNADLLPAPGSGSATANSSLAGYGGDIVPDIVANVRLDQSWGSAQIMGVAHLDNAPYYGTTAGTGGPSQQWGFVVGAGLRLNFPMIAQGDYFQSQFNYTQGALRYLDQGGGAPTLSNATGGTGSYGLMSDCVYGATTAGLVGTIPTGASGCNLTTGWGVNAGYEHYWTPQFHESFIGSYMTVRYNNQANAILCTGEGFGAAGAGTGTAAVAAGGCNNNWQIASGGTRFQYDVSKSLYLGVEFLYQHYYTAQMPGAITGSVLSGVFSGAGPSNFTLKDQNNLAVTLRMHKDFLP